MSEMKKNSICPHIFIIMIILIGSLLMTSCQFSSVEASGSGTVKTLMSDLPKDPRYQFTYRVAEFLNDALYDRYQHDDGTLFRRLMSYHETLSESGEISFVPFCGNHVEILNVDIPEPCVVNYGEEFMNESFYEIDGEKAVAAEAIQIFESFLDLFPLEIADGRGFIESDFRYMKDRRIPVIMGSEYKELFETGDIFEGYYLFERVSFEVIGIAKSGNSFYHPAVGPALYDRYIIMPFERVTNDSPFSRLQLLQETCGFIISENGWETAVSQIQQSLTDSGLADWRDQIVVNTRTIR